MAGFFNDLAKRVISSGKLKNKLTNKTNKIKTPKPPAPAQPPKAKQIQPAKPKPAPKVRNALKTITKTVTNEAKLQQKITNRKKRSGS